MARKRDWRYFRNLLLFTLVSLLAAFYVVLPAIRAYRYIHPTRYPLEVSPADVDHFYEDVTITTRDGLKIGGWYIPSQNGAAIIALHAYNGNRTGVIYHADLFADHGYGVLMIDLRAHGKSEGEYFAFGWDADRDVYAALDYLQGRPDVDPERIGVMGLSIGAEVAMLAASRDTRIGAVVSEGAGCLTMEDWMIAPDPPRILVPGDWVYFKFVELLTGERSTSPISDLVSRIAPRPLFLITADDDRPFNLAYYEAAREPKMFWDRPEPGHIDALFVHPEMYAEQVLEFFDQALLGD